MTQQQRVDAMRQLHWLPAGTYKLPASNSSFVLPDGYHVVLGDDARRLITLSGDPPNNAVEAVVFSPHFDDEVVFDLKALMTDMIR